KTKGPGPVLVQSWSSPGPFGSWLRHGAGQAQNASATHSMPIGQGVMDSQVRMHCGAAALGIVAQAGAPPTGGGGQSVTSSHACAHTPTLGSTALSITHSPASHGGPSTSEQSPYVGTAGSTPQPQKASAKQVIPAGHRFPPAQ